ncbi:MAG: hypothetical protein H6837_21880, partial [Planctomycetes bacterium]|nr:hypothetical protein [Planctomycetota bacterium]
YNVALTFLLLSLPVAAQSGSMAGEDCPDWAAFHCVWGSDSRIDDDILSLNGDLRLLTWRPRPPQIVEDPGPGGTLARGTYIGVPFHEARNHDPYRPIEIPGALPGTAALGMITHVSMSSPIATYLPEATASPSSLQEFWIRPNQAYISKGNIVGKRYAFTSKTPDPNVAGKFLAWFDSPDVATRVYVYWEGPAEGGAYVLELRFVDGSISKFDRYTAVSGQEMYRVAWYKDRFDNKTEFRYDATSHRLIEIEYPQGIKELYTWGANGTLDVSYQNVTLANKLGGTATVADLAWGFGLDSNGNVAYAYYPKSPSVAGSTPGLLPPDNELYNLAASTDRYYILEYTWAQFGGDWKVTQVKEHYSSDKTLGGSSGSKIILTVAYVLDDGGYGGTTHYYSRYRVQQLTNRFGDQYKFYYEETGTGADAYVSKVYHVDPRDNVHCYTRDSLGRTVSRRWTPPDNATGRPRAHVLGGGLGPDPEPLFIEWLYEYGATGCGCNHPTKVTQLPSGRFSEFTWDPNTGRLLTEKIPDPSDNSGTTKLTIEHQYTASWYDATPEGALRKKLIYAKGRPDERAWDFEYLLTSRQQPDYGKKPDGLTIKSPTVTTGQGSTQIIRWIDFDARGRTVAIQDPQSYGGTPVATTFLYATGKPYGNELLCAITEGAGSSAPTTTTLDQDDWGRLGEKVAHSGSSVPTTTQYRRTAEGRLLEAQTPRGATAQRVQVYYDVFGHPCSVLRWNRNSSDGQQSAHGQAPNNPRDWVREEYQHMGSRLYFTFRDRRPLHSAESSGNVTAGPDPWMTREVSLYGPGGELTQVDQPNGTMVTYTRDGYGTLFKTVRTHGTSVKEEERFYIDGNLDVVKVYQPGSGNFVYERNHAGLVRRMVEPTRTAPTQYVTNSPIPEYTGTLGGAGHEWSYDAFGRMVGSCIKDPQANVIANVVYGRDELGRVRTVTESILPGTTTRVTGYEYDKRSQVTEVTHPGNRKVTYVYDDKGRLWKVDDAQNPGENQTEYGYLAATDLVEKVTVRYERETHSSGNSVVKVREAGAVRHGWRADEVPRHRPRRCGRAARSVGVHRFAGPSRPRGRRPGQRDEELLRRARPHRRARDGQDDLDVRHRAAGRIHRP